MGFTKLFRRVVFTVLIGCAFISSVFAIEDSNTTLQAIVSVRDKAAVGSEVVFSAARSVNPFSEQPIVFGWNFGDGGFNVGEEVSHVFQKPGTYEVELTMQVGRVIDRASFPIFIYDHSILLVSDRATYSSQIEMLVDTVQQKNTLLDVVWSISDQSGFFAEEGVIMAALQEKLETLKKTKRIIFWTDGNSGLNGLVRFAQELSPPLDFSDKQIIVMSNDNLDTLSKIARGVFATLQPVEILLAHRDALRDVVLADAEENIAVSLEQQAIPFRSISSGAEKFSVFAPLSFLVNYLISHGIPASVILLVLLLPAIATLVAFFKQVVGLTTFGVYTPSVLTLSFLAIGLKLGLIVFIVVVFTSVLTRKVIKRYRLSYTPRLAIILSFVSLAIFAAIVLLTWLAPLGDYHRVTSLIATSIFPMLIMSTLAEKFVSIQTEKGSYSAIRLLLEVMFVSVACYFVVGKWKYLHTLVLSTPEIIFFFIFVDVLLGRFTGLRLTEYIRFHDVIKKTEEE